MSDLILAAMTACVVLLPATIVMHRRATAPPEPQHDHGQACPCISCRELRHPANSALRTRSTLPRQRDGRS